MKARLNNPAGVRVGHNFEILDNTGRVIFTSPQAWVYFVNALSFLKQALDCFGYALGECTNDKPEFREWLLKRWVLENEIKEAKRRRQEL